MFWGTSTTYRTCMFPLFIALCSTVFVGGCSHTSRQLHGHLWFDERVDPPLFFPGFKKVVLSLKPEYDQSYYAHESGLLSLVAVRPDSCTFRYRRPWHMPREIILKKGEVVDLSKRWWLQISICQDGV